VITTWCSVESIGCYYSPWITLSLVSFNAFEIEASLILSTGDTCAATFSNNNSDWSMTSQGCIKVDVSSLTLHPSLRHLDSLLFGLQRIPSNVRISRNDGNPFDLSWTYEQSSEENIKQIGMEKGIVDRFLNVSDF